ncbi:hypothetical protein C8R44DRAFT_826977 [Mycena epipterygia]|nr:hypothetical protein C8R44DRAFT_826977 [Mycena epipterygia]
MTPMVLHSLFLPGDIRNASGNGGGVLVGYMTRLVRLFHPALFIESLDGKEAAYFNACRAALANHPCPKCLVHKSDLHLLTLLSTMRTTNTMKAAVQKAFKATKKAKKEEILKKNGLHGIEHFLWEFRFSDPYAAYSYDTLHSDDLGKWGHHLWPLLLEALEGLGGKGRFAKKYCFSSKYLALANGRNNILRDLARWPGLKHFNQVTTVHFTDGQSFYDILKSVLPCIVDIFPQNDTLLHCIRAYQRVRIMTGMHCMPFSRLERLGVFIKGHRVSQQYGKNFDFFKQHATSHIVRDIQSKGTTNHGSTRPGEGFQQEAAEAYQQTNFKNMHRINENQETIAWIRMAIDKYNRQREEDEREDEDVEEKASKSALSSVSWRFGAPEKITNSRAFADSLKLAGHMVGDFDSLLRDFVVEHFPEERLQLFKCAHIMYQSVEDWRGLHDIVHCNPSFHGHHRYDSVLLNSDAPVMSFARLSSLLRFTLETKRQFDVALIQEFRVSKWKPKTNWARCQVREQLKGYSLVLMDYVIRGTLLTPATGSGRDNLYFLVDTVDADMFLRADKYCA